MSDDWHYCATCPPLSAHAQGTCVTSSDLDDMASQGQLHPAPTYAYVRDYECDSNPAYGVVANSHKQTTTQPRKPEQDSMAERAAANTPHHAVQPFTWTAPADTVSYSAVYSIVI